MNRTGVIVAVKSYLIRKGIVAILNRVPGITVIREFDSTEQVMKYMQNRQRDLLVICHSLFQQSTEMFTSWDGLPERTLILIQDGGQEVKEGFRTIDTGNSKEEIMHKIHDLLESQPNKHVEPRFYRLSPREKTIVRLVSLGNTNKQIAEKLFISTHTVMTHRKNISLKLGIKSVSGLTVYAIVNNIITIEEVNSLPL